MITNPEINRRYGRAFSRNALILVLETPIYKIVNTAIIGINTPIENKPKVDITPVLKEPIWLAENIKLRRIPAIHGAFRNVNVAPNKNEVIPESLSARRLKNTFNFSGVLNNLESSFQASILCHNPNAISGIPKINFIARLLNNLRAPLIKNENNLRYSNTQQQSTIQAITKSNY